jgi:hypothetical protein
MLRTPSRSRAMTRVRGDALRRARTACEMDARGPSLRPSPCRVASRRVVLTSARPSRAASRKAHGRASGLRRCGGEVDLHLPAEQAYVMNSETVLAAAGHSGHGRFPPGLRGQPLVKAWAGRLPARFRTIKVAPRTCRPICGTLSVRQNRPNARHRIGKSSSAPQ